MIKQFYFTHRQDPKRYNQFGLSEPGSNGNEEVFHILQSLRTQVLPSDAVYCHTQDSSFIWPIDKTLTSTTTPS